MITMPQKISAVNSGAMRVGQTRQHSAAAPAPHAGESFDKVTLSAREGEDSRKLEIQSRLSQEVRTATTTGTLANLRQQVQAGEYRIDAESIAKRMLLLGEV